MAPALSGTRAGVMNSREKLFGRHWVVYASSSLIGCKQRAHALLRDFRKDNRHMKKIAQKFAKKLC